MLFLYEAKKLTGPLFIFLLVLAVLLKGLLALGTGQFDFTPRGSYYLEYLETLRGELTPQKEEFLREERERIFPVLEAQEEMEEKHLNGQISKAEYAEYIDHLTYAQVHQQDFERIYGDYEYILSCRKHSPPVPAEFVDRYYWEYFFSQNSVDFILIALLVFFIPQIILRENASNMLPIIDSSPGGRMKTIHAKMLLAICLSLLVSLLLNGAELLVFIFRFHLDHPTAPLQSLPLFYSCLLPVSLGQYAAVAFLWRVLAAGITAAVIFLLACLCRRNMAAVLISCGLFIVPLVLRRLVPEFYAVSANAFLNMHSFLLFLSGMLSSRFAQAAALFLFGLCWLLIAIVLYLLVKRKMRRCA